MTLKSKSEKNILFTVKRKKLLVLFLLFLLVVKFAANAREVKRVISLAPSITETIYLVGAQDKLAGCTSFCNQAVADGVEVVGSAVDVNIEKILTLQPDLVLNMELTRKQDVDALKKLGIRVETVPTPKNFDEICNQSLYIAGLLNTENNAQKIIGEIRQQVDSLKEIGMALKKQRMFFQIGANPIFTVLPNTFMNDFILFCNGENIANDMTHGTMTRESVLMKNPEVIIIATMGGFGNDEMQVWKSYKGLKAAENGNIFLVDSETSCSPTPDNFLRALTDIVQFISR